MSGTDSVVAQGRPWTVRAAYNSYVEAREHADALKRASGDEGTLSVKVKCVGGMYTVRTRTEKVARVSETAHTPTPRAVEPQAERPVKMRAKERREAERKKSREEP